MKMLPAEVDVLVVGSGAAGMMAALRAASLGLDVTIIEKAHQIGGTTATSGGLFWAPNHGLCETGDSPEKAMEYLRVLTAGDVPEARLWAFVDAAPRMVGFLRELGAGIDTLPAFPDYFPDAPGSNPGRSLALQGFDAADLGDERFHMRAPNPMILLFDRYALDRPQANALMKRSRGWMTW